MIILPLSETLNQHRQLDKLSAADVIIHSGDSTFARIGEEVLDFIFLFSPEGTNLGAKSTEVIPEGIDVLISHRPPCGILKQSNDKRYSQKKLLL